MGLKLAWLKCQGNEWANLFALNLEHPHFEGLQGVYLVWQAGEAPVSVLVGFGRIREALTKFRKSPEVKPFGERDLYVTWAVVDMGLQEGVARYLAKTVNPKIPFPQSDIPPVQANLPSDPPETQGPTPPEHTLPTQEWEDLAAGGADSPSSGKRKEQPKKEPQGPKVQRRIMTDIVQILTHCAHFNASDILLVPREPPMIRYDGLLRQLPQADALPADLCKDIIYSCLNDRQRQRFEQEGELDCSLAIQETRFRLNVYVQQYGVAACFRIIPHEIPEPDALALPPAVLKLTDATRGLILVTGPTGSGKTTTLASMIEHINKRHKKHIISIEDPIEFVFQNKNSVVDQREVGQHTASFAQALRYILRQSPDVILIGEMRDRETMDLAIRAAETGHLCLSTLHTNDAPSTIDRILSEFPAAERNKLCNSLASSLLAVVTQVLVPRKDGGRFCAREVMIMNTAIATLLRDDKVYQIRGAIEAGAFEGMQTLDQSLAIAIQQNLITLEEARAYARSPRGLEHILEQARAEHAKAAKR